MSKEVIEFQMERIKALEKLTQIQQDMIDEQAKIIDEMQFKYADSKARYNMLVNGIDVKNVIFESPIPGKN